MAHHQLVQVQHSGDIGRFPLEAPWRFESVTMGWLRSKQYVGSSKIFRIASDYSDYISDFILNCFFLCFVVRGISRMISQLGSSRILVHWPVPVFFSRFLRRCSMLFLVVGTLHIQPLVKWWNLGVSKVNQLHSAQLRMAVLTGRNWVLNSSGLHLWGPGRYLCVQASGAWEKVPYFSGQKSLSRWGWWRMMAGPPGICKANLGALFANIGYTV
jgi:hypothetical protein